VAPLRYAVRLVDDESRYADTARRLAQEHAELGIGHPLGRGQQKLAAGRANQRVDLAALLDGERRIDADRHHALEHHLVDLIFDQGDQRRHDHRDAGNDQ